jgi:hypothetical protein
VTKEPTDELAEVIDLMRERLVRDAEATTDPRMREASLAIVDMYDTGMVEAYMEAGAIMIRLKEGEGEALWDMLKGALPEAPDPPHEGPS